MITHSDGCVIYLLTFFVCAVEHIDFLSGKEISMVKKIENQPECKGYCMLAGYPDALTVKEVSEILRTTTKTCLKMLDEGWIECVKVGRSYMIPKSKLIKFFNTAYKKTN